MRRGDATISQTRGARNKGMEWGMRGEAIQQLARQDAQERQNGRGQCNVRRGHATAMRG